MKTRVSLKYFANDCNYSDVQLKNSEVCFLAGNFESTRITCTSISDKLQCSLKTLISHLRLQRIFFNKEQYMPACILNH